MSVLGTESPRTASRRQALGLLAAQEDIDLLITDVGLPDIDGHDLAIQARELRPGLKIILASGYSRLAQKKNGMEMPADLTLKLTLPPSSGYGAAMSIFVIRVH